MISKLINHISCRQLPELWPHLRSLDLHDLKLSGALPLSLTTLENLTQLQVAGAGGCPFGGLSAMEDGILMIFACFGYQRLGF